MSAAHTNRNQFTVIEATENLGIRAGTSRADAAAINSGQANNTHGWSVNKVPAKLED
jgi:hypothetical protein